MRFLIVLCAALLIAGPAAADPVTLIVGLLSSAGVTVGLIGTALIRIGVGLVVSELARAKMEKKSRSASANRAGIRTDSPTFGDTTSQSFILGEYATAGNLVAPLMAHGDVGDTPNAYRTRIMDLGDIAFTAMTGAVIDGRSFAFTGAVDPDYGSAPSAARAEYVGSVWAKFYNGSQTAADPMLVAKYGAHPQRPWTSDMIGRGVPYVIYTYKYNPELWKSEPVIKTIVQGIKLYDPRADTSVGGSGTQRWATPSTWAFTKNPVVMIYNIFRGITLPDGSVYGGSALAADLPLANWMPAMTACDPDFIAGYEVLVAEDEPLDVIDELLKAAGAQMSDIGGVYSIRVGAPALSLATWTDDDMLRSSPQDLDPFPTLEGSSNGVHGSFPNPNQLWEVREAPPRYDAAAETADGRRLIASLNFPSVPSMTQVQRLMRAWLKDERRFRRHSVTLPPEALSLSPLDSWTWNSTRNGYVTKLFEVGEMAIDPRTLSVTFGIRERDPADYNWVPGDELPTTAPSALPIVLSAQSVPGFALTAISLTDAASNARRPAIQITWSGALPDVTALEYECRRTTTTVLVAKGVDANIADGNTVISAGLLPSTSYQVRARLVVNRPRAWTAWLSVTTTAAFIGAVDFSGGTIPAIDLSGTLDITQFATNIRPVEIFAALPATGNFAGRMVMLSTTFKVYRHTGSPAGTAGFTVATDGADILANSIGVGVLQAGVVRATELAAEAGVFSKLLVGDITNMAPDGFMVDDDSWALGTGASWSVPNVNATSRRRINMLADAADTVSTGGYFSVETGDTYYAQSFLQFAAGTASVGTMFLQYFSYASGVYTYVSAIGIGSTSSGSRTKIVNQVTVPAGVNAARILFRRIGGGTATLLCDSPIVRKAMEGKLYVDGSITSLHVNTGSFAAAGLALFGGSVQSDNFVTGVSGWRILKTGAAEFSQLIVRNSLVDGAVSDRFYETFTAGVAQTTSPPGTQQLLFEIFTGPTSGAVVHMRKVTFEARGKAGFTTEFVLYARFTSLGVQGSFVELDRWTLTDATWRLYNDSATLGGGYDQVQYRMICASSYTDAAYPIIRNAHLLIQRIEK